MNQFLKLISTSEICALEDSLTSNGLRQPGQVVRINEDRIHRKVLNVKLIGEQQRGRLRLRWEQP
jgi:hypothetical protein